MYKNLPCSVDFKTQSYVTTKNVNLQQDYFKKSKF